MHIEWSLTAAIEFRAAIDFVDAFNPVAASKLAARLEAAADSLIDFPRRGREVSPGIHQLSIVYPYFIRYRVSGEAVETLSVRHGAHDDLF